MNLKYGRRCIFDQCGLGGIHKYVCRIVFSVLLIEPKREVRRPGVHSWLIDTTFVCLHLSIKSKQWVTAEKLGSRRIPPYATPA